MSDTVKTDKMRDGDGWVITATLPSGEQWSTRVPVDKGTAHVLARELGAAATLYLDRAEMAVTLERIYRTHGPMVFEERRSGFAMNVITAYEVHLDDSRPCSDPDELERIVESGPRYGRWIAESHNRTWAGAARKLEEDLNRLKTTRSR